MITITIDGPAGSGKGTVAKELADILKLNYLDSGSIYRVVAFFIDQNKMSINDDKLIESEIKQLKIHFQNNRIFLDNIDISQSIRTEEIALIASKIATSSKIRNAILDLQRSQLKLPGLVAEGRDMGSVVFPKATHKFFITASVEERAQRRYKQLILKGFDVNIHDLVIMLQERDERDTNRKSSPLIVPNGATTIDSTNLTANEVVNDILLYLK
jgi:cytidylate kinase